MSFNFNILQGYMPSSLFDKKLFYNNNNNNYENA